MLRWHTARVVETAAALPDDRFLNRELSWLAFNTRVLDLAADPTMPLLERVKFLAIFANNLDEFFMVRVASLRRRHAAGIAVRSADGLTSREQLDAIGEVAAGLSRRHARLFLDDVRPALDAAGVTLVRWDDLADTERKELSRYVEDLVFPVLTPLAVDPAHPFPYISGLSLNLAVVVRHTATGTRHFARVKVPPVLPRLVPLSGSRFVPIEDLIAAHLPDLFAGMEVVEQHLFRVTRNADFEIDDDETDDLLEALERELVRRRFGPAVRLEVQEDVSDDVLALLVRELEVDERDVLRLPGLLDLTALFALTGLDRPELKDEPFVPVTSSRLAVEDGGVDVFATLREGDLLVHHPYDSFATSVQRFVEAAAADPQVVAIKQTLYRTSGESSIVDALVDAAESGKQVVVLVEIKARFDEQANIRWARALETAGCHVVYGVVGLKTHCKLLLVVRREGDKMRRYAHIGTGNYHARTARTYEDFGLFTADPRVGDDLTDLFNVLTGYSRQTAYQTLLVAPHGIRAGLVERIRWQADRARAGEPARVRLKLNSLVDERVIDALYEASRAGVEVDCVVRGMCALRPGVPGLSETVRVRSVLGRFLEHSRVFGFGPAGDEELWMGSADVMHRNLDRRVEALVRVTDPVAAQQIADVLDLLTRADVAAWDLRADGTWVRRTGELVDAQERLAAARSAT
jgi:polyphosphate kinase